MRPVDSATVGTLTLTAYRGAVDDESESETGAIAEVERTIDGHDGRFLSDCSFVVQDGGGIVGASMVTRFEARPFLTYVVVHPTMQRRGIGAFLIAASGEALRSAGQSRMELFVTEANEPAVNFRGDPREGPDSRRNSARIDPGRERGSPCVPQGRRRPPPDRWKSPGIDAGWEGE